MNEKNRALADKRWQAKVTANRDRGATRGTRSAQGTLRLLLKQRPMKFSLRRFRRIERASDAS